MDATDHDEQYFIFDNRLASFQGPQPVAKRRPSNAAASRTPKALSWPHKSPAPIDLARAGFYFNPQPSNPDNVRCFLCHKDLDGWEDDDDPLQEHLKHSGACGWAICAAIELELGDAATEDPRLPYLLDARKATFAGRWPYEGKKGWKCKTKQLAEAGWKYTPTLESDDHTTCAYCQLALDGWEAGDKPMDEHQRRSPDCAFFTMISQNPAPKKAARGKAARASKVSRLSVQSIATGTSDTQSLADPDDSILTTTTVATQGGRKAAAARTRKTAGGTTAAKGRKTRTKKDEPVAAPESADVDATDETAIAEPPAPVKPARGKKRASHEVEPADAGDSGAPAPKKKRATRVRASNNSVSAETNDYAMFDPNPPEPDEAAIEAELRALEKDMDMDQQLQQQLEQEQELQVPKKGRKTGTRKVSKQTRKGKDTAATAEQESQPAEPERVPEPAVHNPEPPIPVPEVKPKAKPRAKSKKMSQQLQPPQPPPPQHDMEEPDELHEDSIISISSTNTVVREPAEQPAPAKKGRGRPSKKSTESARSSAGHAAPVVPAKITPILPPVIPGAVMTVEIPAMPKRSSATRPGVGAGAGAAPSGTRPSQTDKALPPLPKAQQQQQRQQEPEPRFPLGPPPATPRKQHVSPVTASAQQPTLSPSQSPQSSDAENQPPSSRPATTSAKGKRVALAPVVARGPAVAAAAAVSTPVRAMTGAGSPSKRANQGATIGGLRSAVPWAAADVDAIFGLLGSSKEGGGGDDDLAESLLRKGTDLNTPERAMTVEEFIFHNAGRAERLLKEGCEAMVSVFEQQGTRAMQVLESLVVEE